MQTPVLVNSGRVVTIRHDLQPFDRDQFVLDEADQPAGNATDDCTSEVIANSGPCCCCD